MSSNPRLEFLSLEPTHSASDDGSGSSPLSSIRPHLDTLFSEFARSRPRLSTSPPMERRLRTNTGVNLRPLSPAPPITSRLDLRSLDYVSEYDSHLMCPICHVPFINPVVLECDHTFCASCYEQYRSAAFIQERSLCPTCRTFSSVAPKKASRLIMNMCNDLRVRCPNEYCKEVLFRGSIERHLSRDCREELLLCPDQGCTRFTKRKNYIRNECLHETHVECECGELVELGTGDWLKHKEEECPKTASTCENCGERMARSSAAGTERHVCGQGRQRCPGGEFGCDKYFEPAELDAHAARCPLARIAPHMKKQSQLLSSLQEQLDQVKVRNDVLETGFDKIKEALNKPESSGSSVIEEIERLPSPSRHRYDLMLPAHIRAFTPSPGPSLDPIASSQQHLLALHESLRGNVTTLETDLTHLSAGLSDLDARTSMQIMNETLRIKEDLAHTNAALFSTRAQVQWLLNRERAGQQMGARGRPPAAGSATAASSATAPPVGQETFDPLPSSSNVGADVGVAVSAGLGRPIRRLSGGSQERVKL